MLNRVTKFTLTYSWGFTGYASSCGASAWETDGKGGGVANTLKLMYHSSANSVDCGLLFYGNRHSQRFRAEKMKERVGLTYVAPQVAYRKPALASSCFATVGGGVGYMNYQSKNTFPEKSKFKLSAHGVGINGFVGLEYKFAYHWSIGIEVDALYSPLNPGKCNNEGVPFRQRGKFGLFALTTLLGISSHF